MSYGEIGNLTILAVKRSSTQPVTQRYITLYNTYALRTHTHTHYYRYSRIIQRNNNLFWFDVFFSSHYFFCLSSSKYTQSLFRRHCQRWSVIFSYEILFSCWNVLHAKGTLYILDKTMITIFVLSLSLCFRDSSHSYMYEQHTHTPYTLTCTMWQGIFRYLVAITFFNKNNNNNKTVQTHNSIRWMLKRKRLQNNKNMNYLSECLHCSRSWVAHMKNYIFIYLMDKNLFKY